MARSERSGASAKVAGLGLLLLGLLASSPLTASERFLLQDGHQLAGSVIQMTRNHVMLRRDIGGMAQFALAELREVQIDAGGQILTGRLIGFADGTYELQAGDELLRVQAGRLVSREAIGVAPTEVVATAAPEAEAEVPLAEPLAEQGQGGPIIALAAPVAIRVAAARAREAEEALVFAVALTPPADGALALIYATIDQTAKAGLDYQPQRGVLHIQPGTSEVELRVPLIDNQTADGDKRLELFVSADPSLAVIAHKAVGGTIQDDD